MADGDCVAPERQRERQGSCPSTVAIASPFDISSFTHTPCYCEENVYLLTKKLCKDGVADPMGADLFVLFISNEEKMIVEVSSTCTSHLLASTYEGIFNSRWKLPCTVSYQSSKVPLWHQKASKRNDGLVLWDYHVICIQKERGKELDFVWDLDSDLPFPSPLTTYLSEATRPTFHPVFVNSRLFRVVHAPIFHRCFASDRSHMKDDLGNWLALPPSYEPITAEDGTVNNLSKYIEMREADVLPTMQDSIQGVFSNEYGVVLAEAMLEWFFSQI